MKRSTTVADQLRAAFAKQETKRRARDPRVPKEPSKLEVLFANAWRALDGPDLVAEYAFAPPRRWRFDRLHPASRVAVELEGGVWSGGRHTHPTGFEEDVAKYNRASALGFVVFRVTRKQLDEDPAGVLGEIIARINRTDPFPPLLIQSELLKGK